MDSGSEVKPPDPTPVGDVAPEAPTPAEQAKAARRRVIIGLGGTILILVVVFWFIFSFIIDPEIVVDAFLSLSLVELVVLAVMAAGTYFLLGITLKSGMTYSFVEPAWVETNADGERILVGQRATTYQGKPAKTKLRVPVADVETFWIDVDGEVYDLGDVLDDAAEGAAMGSMLSSCV